MKKIDAIIFDKDGTLFDFQATWAPVFLQLLQDLPVGDRLGDVADALGFDLAAKRFLPHSVVIAGTTGEVAGILAPATGLSHDEALLRLDAAGKRARQTPAVPLPATLGALARQHTLGLVTNDSEGSARAHLEREAVLDLFAFVAGYDSGFGAKPEPGQLLGFCDDRGIEPAATVMVGDSRHDLTAGRAAGMRTVGVLTGVAVEAELADLADVVLPDIGHLATWIDTTIA